MVKEDISGLIDLFIEKANALSPEDLREAITSLRSGMSKDPIEFMLAEAATVLLEKRARTAELGVSGLEAFHKRSLSCPVCPGDGMFYYRTDGGVLVDSNDVELHSWVAYVDTTKCHACGTPAEEKEGGLCLQKND